MEPKTTLKIPYILHVFFLVRVHKIEQVQGYKTMVRSVERTTDV